MSSSSSPASDPKGDELVREADKKLNSWSLFNSDKYQEAVDLLLKAGAIYKMNKNWSQAGDAYSRVAEIYTKNFKDESNEVSNNYVQAAKAYKNCNTQKATTCMQTAVTIQMHANRFSAAAKLWKDMGELFEKDLNLAEAIQAYSRAADCYDTEDSISSAAACRLKVAQLAAEGGDYKYAIEIYEKISRQAIDTEKGIYSVTGYLFKALLCQLALSAKTGDMEAVRSALSKYKDMHAPLSGTREAQLIDDLSTDFEEGDVTKFSDDAFKHDQIIKFDNWTAKILLEVKKNIAAGASAGAGAGDDEPHEHQGKDFTGASEDAKTKTKSNTATASSSSSSSTSTSSSSASSKPKKSAGDFT